MTIEYTNEDFKRLKSEVLAEIAEGSFKITIQSEENWANFLKTEAACTPNDREVLRALVFKMVEGSRKSLSILKIFFNVDHFNDQQWFPFLRIRHFATILHQQIDQYDKEQKNDVWKNSKEAIKDWLQRLSQANTDEDILNLLAEKTASTPFVHLFIMANGIDDLLHKQEVLETDTFVAEVFAFLYLCQQKETLAKQARKVFTERTDDDDKKVNSLHLLCQYGTGKQHEKTWAIAFMLAKESDFLKEDHLGRLPAYLMLLFGQKDYFKVAWNRFVAIQSDVARAVVQGVAEFLPEYFPYVWRALPDDSGEQLIQVLRKVYNVSDKAGNALLYGIKKIKIGLLESDSSIKPNIELLFDTAQIYLSATKACQTSATSADEFIHYLFSLTKEDMMATSITQRLRSIEAEKEERHGFFSDKVRSSVSYLLPKDSANNKKRRYDAEGALLKSLNTYIDESDKAEQAMMALRLSASGLSINNKAS